jgi:hypothetical protein
MFFLQHVAFLHGHIESWHSKNMEETMKALKWENVPGYADLNRYHKVTRFR